MPDPDVLLVDENNLTIDEIDLIEIVCDASLKDVMDGKVRQGKVLRAFSLVALRRRDGTEASDPVTPEENRRAGRLKVGELTEVLGERPTEAAEPPATSKSPRSAKPRASRSRG